MTRIHFGAASLALIVGSIFIASTVQASVTQGNVSPSKANGSFIPGSGIPGANFTIDTGANGEQASISFHDRNSVNPVPSVGNVYFVPAGNDPNNANRTAWNVDFQFTPQPGKTTSDYTYQVQFDIDPGVGTTNYVNVDPITLGDSVFTNPGGGAWSDNTTTGVVANSENYKFSFLAGPTFANSAPGEYQVNAIMTPIGGGPPVAEATAYAVVPEPASLGLVLLGAAGLLVRRPRRA